MGREAALKELSGQAMPHQTLEDLRASYLDSNFDAHVSSWTGMSIDVQRDHSFYMGVERKPNWEEQIKRTPNFSKLTCHGDSSEGG